MRLIPAIDIINGQCVRLSQGDYSKKTIYETDPVDVAKSFEAAGLRYLHLVDLDGAKAGIVKNWEVVEQITKHTKLRVDFGGGVKTEDEINRLLNCGVSQVNIGSLAIKQPKTFEMFLSKYGPEKIILSADVRNELIQVNGWLDATEKSIQKLVKQFIGAGLKFVTCTDISVDGMLTGPNVNLYRKLCQQFPQICWIASGGVSSANDLVSLTKTGVDGVIIGKAIYEKKILLNDLKQSDYEC